jgi:hypothetical protein
MNIHLVIRKYTLSQFADTRYWGNFNLLAGLSLSDDQFLKLINFYSAAEDYRSRILETMGTMDGYGYMFASTPNSLEVYNHYGVLNSKSISEILRSGSDYDRYVISRDALFAELGWVALEERIQVIETEFNEETLGFTEIPTTYQEIESLYSTAQDLNSFLGKSV